jgi:hypothetical protein
LTRGVTGTTVKGPDFPTVVEEENDYLAQNPKNRIPADVKSASPVRRYDSSQIRVSMVERLVEHQLRPDPGPSANFALGGRCGRSD